MSDFEVLIDYQDRSIRLTNERWTHILSHPEMVGQRDRIIETLRSPDEIIATRVDETIHAYHRLYEHAPVTRKYLIVAVKMLHDDAFVVTAFYSSRQKKGTTIWLR